MQILTPLNSNPELTECERVDTKEDCKMAVMKTFCGCLVTKTGAMTVLVVWAVSCWS